MIEHLHDREKALETFGLKGREAEWIALVCLHSGVFTRPQFCYFFEGARRKRALLFVRSIVERGLAVEFNLPNNHGGARGCRVSSKPLYRALGIENVRHRRDGDDSSMLRRLLSLDYVLQYPEHSWLPTEQEKVAFFDSLGIDRRRLPRRIYQGTMTHQTRYFALKLPIAADAKTATFVYVDPGKDTDTELRSWGDSHEWLWRALRSKGIVVRAIVVGADYKATIRAEAPLQTWSQRASDKSIPHNERPSRNDPEVQTEIQQIENALRTVDRATIARYDGVRGITRRLRELKDLPKSSSTIGVTIDGFETWVSRRLRMQESDL